MSNKIRLTVRFVDPMTGKPREISGTYPAVCAMSRLEWAEKQTDYKGHTWEPAR